MTPNFPVAGLMLAAASVAALGVDMLGDTLLWCDFFPLSGGVKYRAGAEWGANECNVYAGFSGNSYFTHFQCGLSLLQRGKNSIFRSTPRIFGTAIAVRGDKPKEGCNENCASFFGCLPRVSVYDLRDGNHAG
jgi:hypothetical protein